MTKLIKPEEALIKVERSPLLLLQEKKKLS